MKNSPTEVDLRENKMSLVSQFDNDTTDYLNSFRNYHFIHSLWSRKLIKSMQVKMFKLLYKNYFTICIIIFLKKHMKKQLFQNKYLNKIYSHKIYCPVIKDLFA